LGELTKYINFTLVNQNNQVIRRFAEDLESGLKELQVAEKYIFTIDFSTCKRSE